MSIANRENIGRHSTTDEVLAGIDLTGKRILITGGSSGLGAETARALASKGAHVVITARNTVAGATVVKSIIESTGNANVEMMSVELGSLKSIRAFAGQFLAKYDTLDILINNAGVMACPHKTTEDGFELQFGVNHLGHFLLTKLITPALVKADNARIVCLSSMAHHMSPVVFQDIQFEHREYNSWASYGQSKSANALHALGLDERLKNQGVRAFSVHPGVIETNLGRHLPEEDLKRLEQMKPIQKTIPSGAATSVYAATAPELDGKGGLYLADCQIGTVQDEGRVETFVRSYVMNKESANRLWEISEKMTA